MAETQEKAKSSGNGETPGAAVPEGALERTTVQWDDGKMVTSFANVVNIQSTLEQVDLFFGTNQTWNITNDKSVRVELTNRVILTPYAAKRMWRVLGGVLKEYEARHGALETEQ